MRKIPKLILGGVVVGLLWGCAPKPIKQTNGGGRLGKQNGAFTQKPKRPIAIPSEQIKQLEQENNALEEKLARLDNLLKEARQLLAETPNHPSEKDISALETKRHDIQNDINARKEKLTQLRQLSLP